MKIKNIAIVGGTHGNEYTGVYAIRKLRIDQIQKRWSELNIQLVIGNPRAYEKCVRFIDSDLNRAFLRRDLENFDLASYEANRAKIINQIIGPKDSPKTDFMIDIHTTTANMGVSIILVGTSANEYRIASYIQSKMHGCHIYLIPAEAYGDRSEHSFLSSLAPHGFALEVGPVPNGVVRHDCFDKIMTVIHLAFEFIQANNAGALIEGNETIEIFRHREHVEFPRDAEGQINSIIHQNIQDKDYEPLKKGDPIFLTLEGNEIVYEKDETLYPVFINEAAYYNTNIAFSLTEKIKINL